LASHSVSAIVKAAPPAVGVSRVRGHALPPARTMSAACFACARSCFAETGTFTYGFFADAVRWQIVRVAVVLALAVGGSAGRIARLRPSEESSGGVATDASGYHRSVTA